MALDGLSPNFLPKHLHGCPTPLINYFPQNLSSIHSSIFSSLAALKDINIAQHTGLRPRNSLLLSKNLSPRKLSVLDPISHLGGLFSFFSLLSLTAKGHQLTVINASTRHYARRQSENIQRQDIYVRLRSIYVSSKICTELLPCA